MPDYTLHAYFRSSCSARLRIALNLKSIEFDVITVNLLKDEHCADAYRHLNPSASVPLLVCHKAKLDDFTIGQSLAALEYLEEVHPEHPLMPPASDPEARAIVRTLADIICMDIQPVTNMKVMKRVNKLGGDGAEWNRELMTIGLGAYEAVASKWAGKFSFKDEVTLADVCLMPGVWNAQRFGVDISQFPTIKRIADGLEEHPAIIKAQYFNQPDTPEELRKK